jgi:hypothetical protein
MVICVPRATAGSSKVSTTTSGVCATVAWSAGVVDNKVLCADAGSWISAAAIAAAVMAMSRHNHRVGDATALRLLQRRRLQREGLSRRPRRRTHAGSEVITACPIAEDEG